MPAGFPTVLDMAIWGLVATVGMTGVLQGANGMGLSRLSIPFVVGTAFTGNRRVATVLGFVLYVVGGWAFALLYFLLFESIGIYSWWLGASAGFLHGLFLLVAVFPLIPFVHPRMATSYDSAANHPILEPPGFLGLHYGPGTPLSLLLAQTLYGGILGMLPQIAMH